MGANDLSDVELDGREGYRRKSNGPAMTATDSGVRPLGWACIAVGLHCGSVWICILLSDMDSRREYLPPWSPTNILLGVAFWVALFSWLLCPLIVLVQTARSPRLLLVLACAAEVLLCYAQHEAIRPMIQ
jgi:hypothetical protein